MPETATATHGLALTEEQIGSLRSALDHIYRALDRLEEVEGVTADRNARMDTLDNWTVDGFTRGRDDRNQGPAQRGHQDARDSQRRPHDGRNASPRGGRQCLRQPQPLSTGPQRSRSKGSSGRSAKMLAESGWPESLPYPEDRDDEATEHRGYQMEARLWRSVEAQARARVEHIEAFLAKEGPKGS